MNFWDQKFSESEDYKYGTEPNVFVREQASRLKPHSRVLLPGDGEGRNGVYLASLGHDCISVDMSTVGIEKTKALAKEKGVSLQTILADLSTWQVDGQYDAIVSVYCHLPSSIRQAVHRKLAAALKPGGFFILEAFSPAQLAFTSGGPKDTDMLYTPEMLQDDFAALLNEKLLSSGEVELAEGSGHVGKGAVTRHVGERKP